MFVASMKTLGTGLSLAHFAIICYSTVKEAAYNRFVGDLDSLLEKKRDVECKHILASMRPGICIAIDKDCCYKRFNGWLKNQDRTKAFIYVAKGGNSRSLMTMRMTR